MVVTSTSHSSGNANQKASSTSLAGGALFGSPALWEGEDAKAYDDLASRIRALIKPEDVLEELWVQDLIDDSWQVIRLRRLIASLVAATAQEALREILLPLVGDAQASTLAAAWTIRKSDVGPEIDQVLAAAGLTIDAAVAQALSHKIDAVERIDHMARVAEAGRNATVREIERHRAVSGLRRAVEGVDQTQLRVIESTGDGASGQ
jgi:hypothetical protein